MENNPKITG